MAVRQTPRNEELEWQAQLQRLSAARGFADPPTAYFFVSPQGEASRYPPPAEGEKPGPLDWAALLLAGPRLKRALERAWAGQEAALAPAWYSPADGIIPLEAGAATGSRPKVLQQRWLSIAFLPLCRQGTAVTDVCVRVQDETNRRLQQEEQRWHDQQRCRNLLAEALSHDLNNQLGVILAQASGLRLATPPGQLPAPGLDAIMDAVQRAAGLLRGATAYLPCAAGLDARPAAALQAADLNSILSDCAVLLAHMAQGRLEVGLELGAGVPAVPGEDDLLRTMVLALGRHMLAVLPPGRRLRLKTFRRPSTVAGETESAGLSIGEDVADAAGSERTAESRQESPAEELALSSAVALARAIARVHRGHCVNTGAGARGASWEIVLPGAFCMGPTTPQAVAEPIAEAQALMVPPPLPRPLVIPGGQSAEFGGQNGRLRPPNSACRILVAEDEENFRGFMEWALRERGYEVIAAKDGQEGFERFQEAPESFGLAILDAYMPRMGGLEAYLRMQALRPDLPVLFASGFARGASVDALVAGCPGPASVLLKPFTAADLIEAVQKALTPK